MTGRMIRNKYNQGVSSHNEGTEILKEKVKSINTHLVIGVIIILIKCKCLL